MKHESPPEVLGSALEDASFERLFRDNLHNKLLLRTKSSAIKSSEAEARRVRQASPARLGSMVDDARVALGDRELKVTAPASGLTAAPHKDDEIIIQETRQKRRILQEYEDKFGTNYPDSITTKKKLSTLISILPQKSFV